eukprot:CAMPEP_0113598978 /NCGR_PEP_ID=MMETSP0015_2-20120614/41888_1 /TAXON_ID=2838 /ORGANISM="Odontella" /LENGTH=60 /DNA_ID=CAMNT_0000507057 /DNA_START=350 /DNA_END=528 /DNA_ORIENTATION=- /assembly_acc=CAM_ASM_000160
MSEGVAVIPGEFLSMLAGHWPASATFLSVVLLEGMLLQLLPPPSSSALGFSGLPPLPAGS